MTDILLSFDDAGVTNFLTGDTSRAISDVILPPIVYTGSVVPSIVNVGGTDILRIFVGDTQYWPKETGQIGFQVVSFSANTTYELAAGTYGAILIGGGGAGAQPGGGGGGGGGAVVYVTFEVTQTTNASIVVGTGGVITENSNNPLTSGSPSSITINGNVVAANGGNSASGNSGGAGGTHSINAFYTTVGAYNGGNGGNGDPTWGTGGGGGAGGGNGGTTVQGIGGTGGTSGQDAEGIGGVKAENRPNRTDWDGASGGGGGRGPLSGGGGGGSGTVGDSAGAEGGGGGTGEGIELLVLGTKGPNGINDGASGASGKPVRPPLWFGGGGGGGRTTFGQAGDGGDGYVGILQLQSSSEPVIPTLGLTTQLEAWNVASYSGSGNTWFDVSGNSNNATLVNSPSFSTNHFQLNGSSSYIDLNRYVASGQSEFTIILYVEFPSVVSNSSVHLLDESRQQFWQHSLTYGGYYTRDTSTGVQGSRNNDITNFASTWITSNTKRMVTMRYSVSSSLKNLTFDSQTASSFVSSNSIDAITSADASTTNTRIGWPGDGAYFGGKVYAAYVYNRYISDEELNTVYQIVNSNVG